jgi:hypothetical protein
MRNLHVPMMIAIAASLGVLIVGCTAPGTGVAERRRPPAAATEGGPSIDTVLAESRQRLLAKFPQAQIPEVEFVRYISQDEYGEVRAECLTALGFPTAAHDDGGFGGSFTRDQAEAHAVADYTCEVRFPLDPKYTAPLTNAQLVALYDYYVNELTPCLESAGESVGPPPSESVFIEGYSGSDPWTPYLALGTGADYAALEKACPSVPVTFYD